MPFYIEPVKHGIAIMTAIQGMCLTLPPMYVFMDRRPLSLLYTVEMNNFVTEPSVHGGIKSLYCSHHLTWIGECLTTTTD